MASLQPVYSRPITKPDWSEFTRPELFSGSIAPVMIVADYTMLSAYYLDGQPAWTIEGVYPALILGWAAYKGNLYVLHGDILCQYDATAFPLRASEPVKPLSAVSFRADRLSSWSYEAGDADDGLAQLFAAPGNVQSLSSPLYDSVANRIHVLRSNGTLYSFRVDLSATLGTYEVKKTSLTPDDGELALYLEPVASGAPRVCWISGRKVAVADTGELETPEGDIETWRWSCIGAFADQPSYKLGGVAFPFLATRLSYQGVQSTLLVRSNGAQWTYYFLVPGLFPKYTTNGEMDFAGIGKLQVGSNLFMLETFPPESQRLSYTDLSLPGKHIADLTVTPYLVDEPGGPCLYVIWSVYPNDFCFAKYRIWAPDMATSWTMSWWQTIYQSIDSAKAIFSAKFEQAVADASRQSPGTPVVEVPRYSVTDFSAYGTPPGPLDAGYGDPLWSVIKFLCLDAGVVSSPPPSDPAGVYPAAGGVLMPSSDRFIPASVTTVKAPRKGPLGSAAHPVKPA